MTGGIRRSGSAERAWAGHAVRWLRHRGLSRNRVDLGFSAAGGDSGGKRREPRL